MRLLYGLLGSQGFSAPDGPGGDLGDPGPDVAPDDPGALGGGAEEFSFEFTDPSGAKTEFGSREDLTKYLTERTMAKSDYSRAHDTLRGEREAFATQMADFNKRVDAHKADVESYRSFKDAMDRNPALFQEFRQKLSQPVSAEDGFMRAQNYVDPQISELKATVQALTERLDGNDTMANRDSAAAKLLEEFPDFDRQAVENFIQSVSSEEDLMRYAYHALKGQQSPLDAQALAAAEAEEGRKVTPSARSTSKPPSQRMFKSVDEARAAAHADAS
jgi:hypothetical protein